jgi:hypothetical protein
MQKRLAFFSIALGVAGVVLTAVACDDSEPPSNFNEKPDGGDQLDTGPSFNTDGTAGNDDAPIGPVNCEPSLPTTFTPEWIPPTKTSACTTAELGEYYDACTPDMKAEPCTTWMTAHPACTNCIEPDDNSGPIQLYRDRTVVTLNVGGCIAIQQNDLAADKCGAKYDGNQQCRRRSCDGCFAQPGATFTDFQICQGKAATTGCVPYTTEQNTACGRDYQADPEVAKCFPTADEQRDRNGANADAAKAANKSFYSRVEGIYCGPP